MRFYDVDSDCKPTDTDVIRLKNDFVHFVAGCVNIFFIGRFVDSGSR